MLEEYSTQQPPNKKLHSETFLNLSETIDKIWENIAEIEKRDAILRKMLNQLEQKKENTFRQDRSYFSCESDVSDPISEFFEQEITCRIKFPNTLIRAWRYICSIGRQEEKYKNFH